MREKNEMTFRPYCCLAIGFAFINMTGCSTIAKKAIRESKGADSDLTVISESGHVSFSRFGSVEVLPIQSELRHLVPVSFRSTLPSAIKSAMTGRDGALRNGKGRTLTVQPIATFFLIKGRFKELVGSYSYAACVFVLSEDGRELSRVQIISRSGANHTDLGDLAREMGRSLNEYAAGLSNP